MAHRPSLSAAPATTGAPAPTLPPRHRLRAVDRDETVDVSEFLPPGATWLPAPPHTLPALPGRPPMVGYLVLVPADQQPSFPGVVPVLPAPQETAGARSEDDADDADDTYAPRATDSDGLRELVRVDVGRRTAEVDGRPLDLTYLEFELLAHLVAHPHRVHTRDQLVTTVWGYGHVGDGRTVDVHIARLRRKLGSAYRHTIQTVRRVGYKYTPPVG